MAERSLLSTPCCWLATLSFWVICSISYVHGNRACFIPVFQATINSGCIIRTQLRQPQRVLFSESPPSQQQQQVQTKQQQRVHQVWNDNESDGAAANDRQEDDNGETAFKTTKTNSRMRKPTTNTSGRSATLGKARWESLPSEDQETIRKLAQARAMANKKKREPAEEKKQRMMMYYKKAQLERKKASRVSRPLKFSERTPLASLMIGSEVTGIVISLTPYGAYVDVGTECDGLLHISQLSRDFFVEHPRQVLSPGQNITVRVTSTSPSLRKLHLSMLPKDLADEEEERREGSTRTASIERFEDGDDSEDLDHDDDDDDDVIRLEELDLDDELWGEIVRVTDYGAYINVGAEVDAFLHFMDHPWFARYEHPREYMSVGQRVRVWISNLERESPGKRRIKLTANRPPHLPGPRRDVL